MLDGLIAAGGNKHPAAVSLVEWLGRFECALPLLGSRFGWV